MNIENLSLFSPARGLRLSPAQDKTCLSQGIRRKERHGERKPADKPQQPHPALPPNPSQQSQITQDLSVVSQADAHVYVTTLLTTHAHFAHALLPSEAQGLGSRGEPQTYIAGTWLAEGRSIGLD